MSITIYKDAAANAIFIEDANGVQFLNSLQTTVTNGACNIHDLAKDIDIVSETPYDQFVDQNGNSYGNNSTEVCNALNAIFASSGGTGTEIPEITSNLSINLVEGQTLNYELTATYGVGYEWDLSSVSGVTTVDGNNRKIVGGSSLASGTYTIPVKAVNYNGEDSENITLTVSTPPFANTKSIQFNNNDYLGANASQVDNIFGRASNGTGASDAWSLSFWFKGSTDANNSQTVFYFGDNDTANGGHIYVRFLGNQDKLRLQYGSNNNYLRLETANASISTSNWQHVLITYNGGTTGASSGDIANYYNRFKIFINGAQAATTNSHANYGYSGGIDPDNFRIGRYSGGNYMRGSCKVDELATFDSDQSANISDIYNSGAPFNLATLATQPDHWWRMGDGDTFPNLVDSGTEANCTFVMYNMTVADIVSDVP